MSGKEPVGLDQYADDLWEEYRIGVVRLDEIRSVKTA